MHFLVCIFVKASVYVHHMAIHYYKQNNTWRGDGKLGQGGGKEWCCSNRVPLTTALKEMLKTDAKGKASGRSMS